MEKRPPNGQLRCYVCGCEGFTIWYRRTEGSVMVQGNIIVPNSPVPEVYTLLCARCGVLQYESKRGWYTGNISATWDEEKQELKWPAYKREVRPAPQQKSVESVIKGLSEAEKKALLELFK
jgi:hypothetical protein